MNKFSFILVFAAVAGLSHADLRSDINGARKRLEKVILAKDVKGTEGVFRDTLTPDFKFKQGAQTQDAKTFINEFAQTLVMMDKIDSTSARIVTLKQHGNTATGTTEHRMKGIMKGPDKKLHTMDWTGEFTEQYRKVDGKWKTSAMIAGKQTFLMDGKPTKM